MSKFVLCKKKYYNLIKSLMPLTEILENDYKKCIGQIIERYNIKNKKILSIGPGIGNEEYYFSIDNELTMVDIDEQNSLIKLLSDNYENIKYENDENIMFFILDDICNQINPETTLINTKMDVIYISSLTIDIIGKNERYLNTGELFIPVYKNLIDTHLKENGLFIQQLYGSSIIPPPEIIIKKLEELGVTVLDIYQFEYSPSIMLLITIKSNKNTAKELYKNYKSEITNFHARAFQTYDNNKRLEAIKIKHVWNITLL